MRDYCKIFVANVPFKFFLLLGSSITPFYVHKNEDVPPRTHNLLYLVDSLKLQMEDPDKIFLFDLNQFYIGSRYPQQQEQLSKNVDGKKAKVYFEQTKEIYKCLKENASVKQIVKETADFLSSYIQVEKLVLFGSYQYGKPRKDSDFDIAVISEDFERMDFWNKLKLFAKATLTVDSRLELRGFSKKEYLKPDTASFLSLIKKKEKLFSLKNNILDQ